MKKSEMLREAKKFLWDGVSKRNRKEVYICLALSFNVGFKQTNELRKIIYERIGGFGSIDKWLHDKYNIPKEQFKNEAMQAYRHQWVDMLIEEFEAKGD